MSVVIKEVAYGLFHVPDFVRYGSKPLRDVDQDPAIMDRITGRLRSFDECVAYPPHQAFIGNRNPDELRDIPQPWYENADSAATRQGPFGEVMPEEEFYGWMKIADDFNLLWLESEFVDRIRPAVAAHPYIGRYGIDKLSGTPSAEIEQAVAEGSALPVFFNDQRVGSLRRDHDLDDTLKPEVLMENLMAKASGSLAMMRLLERAGADPEDIDFVLDCTETAIGDRYNRGGGSLSKAMAEFTGCVNASGNDIRAFCCAPVHAIINAAGLVESGIFDKVIVAGGGCLAKLGMKFAAHLMKDMPVLEDVLGGIAFLITKDDGLNPVLRLDAVGKHDVGAGSSQQSIMTSLVLKPLEKLGLTMTEIDKYSTELHNAEITLPAGSGDTPKTNYMIMASLAALNNQIAREDIPQFAQQRGMPGYAPTQGHVPAAVPYLGHAIKAMRENGMNRSMMIAKGSLFLGRMSKLSDGMSFIIEKNPALK